MPQTIERLHLHKAKPSDEAWREDCEISLDDWQGRVGGEEYDRVCVARDEPTFTLRQGAAGEPWESLPNVLKGIGDAILQSRAMLDLQDNWDEDGAARIGEETWRRAATFLVRQARWAWDSYQRVIDTPDITPGPDGSIDLHWDRPSYEMLINIPVGPKTKAGFYGDDRGGTLVKGTLDPTQVSKGLLDWLTKTS
jgi:hypothetical protein